MSQSGASLSFKRHQKAAFCENRYALIVTHSSLILLLSQTHRHSFSRILSCFSFSFLILISSHTRHQLLHSSRPSKAYKQRSSQPLAVYFRTIHSPSVTKSPSPKVILTMSEAQQTPPVEEEPTTVDHQIQEAPAVAAKPSEEATDTAKKTPTMRRKPPKLTKGRLSTREMNFGMPTNLGAEQHVEEELGQDNDHWRKRALKFLHSPQVQITLMSLLLLDVLILFVELFLLASYPNCSIIERDAISCCPVMQGDAAEHVAGRWLAEEEGDEHGHHDVCNVGMEADYESDAGCDPHKWGRVHNAETALFALTITILSVFMIELNVEMIALRPTIFFRQFSYLLDYIIISVSLALEILFHSLSDDKIQSLVGLLVFVRIWRFVRIGHGIVEITNEVLHKDHEKLVSYTEQLEELLQQHNIALPEDSTTSDAAYSIPVVGNVSINYHDPPSEANAVC
jgi:hypothetical protein